MHIAVDFHVQRSRQEQDKYAVEPQMGAGGPAAEKEYKWGYLIIAEGSTPQGVRSTPQSPTHPTAPPCAASFLTCTAGPMAPATVRISSPHPHAPLSWGVRPFVLPCLDEPLSH